MDFAYFDRLANRRVIEDTKGIDETVSRLKRRPGRAHPIFYGVEVRVLMSALW